MDGGGGERRRVAKITAARGRRTSRTVRRRRAVSRRPAGESSPPGPARPATLAVGDGGEVRAEAGTCPWRRGSPTVNLDPAPGVLTTPSAPPWASTTR